MVGAVLFAAFAAMLVGGVPIGVALGLAGALAIWLAALRKQLRLPRRLDILLF